MPENVGGAMRAAHCYGADLVLIERCRADLIRHASNTPKAQKHTPTLMVDSIVDMLPMEADIVCVDMVDDAVSLIDFAHPERAIYVFGPEDGTVAGALLSAAKHKVYIPTRNCMNLAASVNVVLYDRLLKCRT